MVEWEISDQDIETTEKLLLPDRAHFPEDARNVIRCWHSADVAACPGSGKTTVLLAKLKLLADRMPLENGAGICVLSHTNVAVDEIRKRLSGYADKLLSYPNYIGTIQSFVDKFVTMPYLRNIVGRNVQAVDDLIYAQHMQNRMWLSAKYSALNYVTKNSFEASGQFTERLDHTQALYVRDDGALCVGKQKRVLAGANTKSAEQYKALLDDLLKIEGIMRYRDTYVYAKTAINDLPKAYTDLFSSRFQYVFIDEYQDCDEIQRRAIDAIFNSTKCTVIKIGDADQAIYNSSENETPDWVPQDGFLPIMTSCRYSQEIADVIFKLQKDPKNITTYVGKTGVKPILLIFDSENIDKVIGKFINVLETHGLYDNKGVYKAIGAAKKEDLSGLKIGSYWSEFDGSAKKQSEYNYWALVDDIIASLLDGKLYKAERIVRKLLCRIFHYAKIRHPISGKEYSVATIKRSLDDEYQDIYRQWIYEMSRLQNIERETIDCLMRQKINELLKIMNPQADDIFDCLPEYFLDKVADVSQTEKSEKNIFIDPIRGRRIEFDTIHGVKGETHDATLYLETDRQGSSDLNRILPYYGVGKIGSSNLFDYSRKLAYVGMSRPKKLLCVAMQAKTYEKSKGIFADDWEIIDLRG
ncbi:UvrD-helicase domain-containing protein [Hominifimenecus sp. rT4P-3]|uniref:UvrD-helicase domain-containing protein n=1 Tax=Hominifimenecus sp. rT4P-3 TaxID=3242979 RepID=UPI003DA36AAD